MGLKMEKKKKKKKSKRGEKVTFLCMQMCDYADLFSIDGRKKKGTGAVGMKVNNLHEFVKKINNAAFVG